MKVSTKGRYALRVMLDLAEHRSEGYIPLKTIAARQGISQRYLDQIMLLLNRSDFLKTTRGAQGGYKLAKSPDQYTLGAILRLTEGSLAPVACLEHGAEECDRYATCMARKVWQGLGDAISGYVDSLTLQDILNQYGGKAPQDFSI